MLACPIKLPHEPGRSLWALPKLLQAQGTSPHAGKRGWRKEHEPHKKLTGPRCYFLAPQLNMFSCIHFLHKISREQRTDVAQTPDPHNTSASELELPAKPLVPLVAQAVAVRNDLRPFMRSRACTQPPAFCLFSKPRALQWRRATAQHEWAIPPGMPSAQQQ